MKKHSELEKEFEIWWETHESNFHEYTKARKKEFERFWIRNERNIAKLKGPDKEKFEEMDRMASAPGFDERACEEGMFGGPYDDGAAEQRPPTRKTRTEAELASRETPAVCTA